MLLAIDIGNTNVTMGLSVNDEWQHIWRLPTITDGEALMYYEVQISNLFLESEVDGHTIESVIISTVVPDLKEIFEKLSLHFFKVPALVVGPHIYDQLPIKVINPTELGTDLYANAIAAYHRFPGGCIVADFGTALTFTVVGKDGMMKGVLITPGLKTAIAALFSKTAQLPEVPLELPETVLGKNTVHAIQSGVLNGYIGLVRHTLAAIRAEAGASLAAIATGGLSSILTPLKTSFDSIDSTLTLEGLKLIGHKYSPPTQ